MRDDDGGDVSGQAQQADLSGTERAGTAAGATNAEISDHKRGNPNVVGVGGQGAFRPKNAGRI